MLIIEFIRIAQIMKVLVGVSHVYTEEYIYIRFVSVIWFI